MVDLNDLMYTDIDAATLIAKKTGDNSPLIDLLKINPKQVMNHKNASDYIVTALNHKHPTRRKGRPPLSDFEKDTRRFEAAAMWYYKGRGRAIINKGNEVPQKEETICKEFARMLQVSECRMEKTFNEHKDDDGSPANGFHLGCFALGILESNYSEYGQLTPVGPSQHTHLKQYFIILTHKSLWQTSHNSKYWNEYLKKIPQEWVRVASNGVQLWLHDRHVVMEILLKHYGDSVPGTIHGMLKGN